MQEAQLKFTGYQHPFGEQPCYLQTESGKHDVRAPVDGVLSGFDIQIGQSISRGERFGQIDTPNDFKLTARIDEFYLDRISLGQTASYNDFELVSRKIYPQVQDGQFRVDFGFTGEQPEGIRRGQSLQTRLSLGDASEAVLIPNGTFFQDPAVTGSSCQRQTVAKLCVAIFDLVAATPISRVLDGLSPGEQVVLSSYSGYREMDRLTLN